MADDANERIAQMADDAHEWNFETPPTHLAQPVHECKSCQSSLDGATGISEFAASAPGSELQIQRISQNRPDSTQRAETRLPSPVRAGQSSAENLQNKYQSWYIADGGFEAPTDGFIHPRGQGGERDRKIKGHIAKPYSQKPSHAARVVGLDPVVEASPTKMERGRYTSTLGQCPSRSGHGKGLLMAGPLSKRSVLVLLALEATGGVLMTQWRRSWPGDLCMGHCEELSRVTPNTTAWGSNTEDTSLLDYPSVLLLGIVSSFASLAFHYHQTRVENQDLVLIATVGPTVVMSSLLGLDASTILLRVAPWATMLGFWVNTYRGSGR